MKILVDAYFLAYATETVCVKIFDGQGKSLVGVTRATNRTVLFIDSFEATKMNELLSDLQ
jgi:hypothetical protein